MGRHDGNSSRLWSRVSYAHISSRSNHPGSRHIAWSHNAQVSQKSRLSPSRQGPLIKDRDSTIHIVPRACAAPSRCNLDPGTSPTAKIRWGIKGRFRHGKFRMKRFLSGNTGLLFHPNNVSTQRVLVLSIRARQGFVGLSLYVKTWTYVVCVYILACKYY